MNIPSFRAWHKKSKQMLYPPFQLDFIGDGHVELVILDEKTGDKINYGCTGADCFIGNSIELSQFTGILDTCNDKKIYGGDFIEVSLAGHTSTIHIVQWGDVEYPAFDLWPSLADDMNSLSFLICADHPGLEGFDYKVVGNVYENPEILEELKRLAFIKEY